MTMIPKYIKTKVVDWLFEKPLAISISLMLNIVLFFVVFKMDSEMKAQQIRQDARTERLEDRMFELQNSIIKDNTKELHEFNIKTK